MVYLYSSVSLFIMLYLNHVLSELCYKGTILQKNYRKMTMNGHFPITPLWNSMVKNKKATTLLPTKQSGWIWKPTTLWRKYKIGECNATAYEFLRLMCKFELKKYSR